ncbi:MAG: hypothetical protein CVT84_08100 [Alphaproteobacteria bacterium HGW-Alphaproteobacteria-6]|nr:MAG: hypothetical protein CVT84_08100 [Alphaproteobacteria bacterium HGW-Alphaproteobacteria-6]
MARANRVTPEGQIVADPGRGLFMGNRGILHDAEGRILAPFRHRNWVCCVTAFKGRRREIMAPGRYTELFFLDEAVALAAGHRPCGECRRADYAAFRSAWAAANGTDLPTPRAMDRALHAARVTPRQRGQRRHEADLAALPDGTFIAGDAAPLMVLGARLLPWTPAGYGAPCPRPTGGRVAVLTPAPTVAVLRAGYRPVLHCSAGMVPPGRGEVADGSAEGAG